MDTSRYIRSGMLNFALAAVRDHCSAHLLAVVVVRQPPVGRGYASPAGGGRIYEANVIGSGFEESASRAVQPNYSVVELRSVGTLGGNGDQF